MHNSCNQARDFYEVLALDHSAPEVEVRRAFRRAALATHPDKGGSKEAFQLAVKAFEVLSCPLSRAAYDRAHQAASISVKACFPNGHQNSDHASCFSKRAQKRPLSPDDDVDAQTKRGRYRDARQKSSQNRRRSILLDLWVVLQHMSPEQRRAALTSDPGVSAALLRFAKGGPPQALARVDHRLTPRSSPTHGIAEVRSVMSGGSLKYKADVQFSGVRVYTLLHADLGTVIERHMALVRIRHAVASASADDPEFWLDAGKVYRTCTHVFRELGTTEEQLQMRGWVRMDAAQWLGSGCKITSPATSLARALDIHARLLRAKAASWEVFRSEWVRIMQLRGQITCDDGEKVANQARHRALQDQFSQLVLCFKATLGTSSTAKMKQKVHKGFGRCSSLSSRVKVA